MSSPPLSPDPTVARRRDGGTGLVAFAATAVVFWPVERWLIAHTLPHEQLKNAFVVLLVAVGLTILQHGAGQRWWFAWSRLSLGLLVAAYALFGAALALRVPWLMLVGAIAALAAAGVFALGPHARWLALGIATGAAAFIVLVLAFPVLDWPLRQMSGVYSAQLLGAIGLAPQLTVGGVGDEVKLLLTVGDRIFEVAPECNGFGTIASTTLLALLLAFSPSREPWWWRVLLIPAAAAVGMLLNLMRIFAICLLAPVFPRHYAVLHEIAGILALLAALALVWWLSAPRLPRGRATPA